MRLGSLIGSGLGSIGIIAVLPCSLLCDCDYHSCHPERSRRISLAYCVLCFRLLLHELLRFATFSQDDRFVCSGLFTRSELLIPVHALFKCYTRAAKDIERAANGEVDFAIGE